MKAGTKVRITKVSEKRPGLVDIGHWAEGVLSYDVKEGEPVLMERSRRRKINDGEPDIVEMDGVFNTSVVEWVQMDFETVGKPILYVLKTRNSTWVLEEIN